jgi:putative tricarboxylic transport membrane protein
MLDAILSGFGQALSWQALLASTVGVILGLVVGALPGLTISMGMVLILPITFVMGPVTAISMMLGLYIGGMTGGAVSAILLNIPGTPSASATVIDGFQMAKKGLAGKALGISVIASLYGGMLSLLCLITIAPLLAKIALSFQAPELFALIFLAMSVICSFAQVSLIKGLISGVIGLIVMTVGLDPILGTPRFTFGTVELQAGVSFIAAMIGLFAIPEILTAIQERGSRHMIPFDAKLSNLLPTRGEVRSLLGVMTSGAIIGVIIGIIPGIGGPIAAFLSYDYAKRRSRNPEQYGTGIPEGVAVVESANDGVTGGDLIPTLSLGIPGDPITAIMMGGLIIQGLHPGPLLFQEHADFIYGIFAAFFVAKILTFLLAFASIRPLVRVLSVPKDILLPLICLLCIVGSYALRNSFFDIGVMLFFGCLGTVMRAYGFPIIPVVLGIILGPDLEEHLRMSLILSHGDPTVFVTRPISLFLLLLALASMLTPFIKKGRRSPLTST